MHLSKVTAIGLEYPLKIAANILNNHQTLAACYTVDSFLGIVKTDELTDQITAQQATDLRQQATAIQNAIGSSASDPLLLQPPPISISSLPSYITGEENTMEYLIDNSLQPITGSGELGSR